MARPFFTAVRLIIAVNIVIFLAWWASKFGWIDTEFMGRHFLVSFDALAEGRFGTLIGSAFSHSLALHLALNLFVLNSFGPIIEETIGFRRFVIFYFSAGVSSSLCHSLVSKFILNAPDLPALGASGAIAGIIVLFSLLFPRQKILLLGFIPVPAILGALLFVALDIWGVIAQADGGGLPIGHGAHLGGSLVGLIYALLLKSRAPNDPINSDTL